MASTEGESRYWRMCLLLLNTSRNILRQIVDHLSTTGGCSNFEDVLNYKIDHLFHLRFKHCCCGNVSSFTPLYTNQWNSLYNKVPTALPHKQKGECPHSYQAISGITPAVLDTTLCCLILKNLFPTVPRSDVETIRTVRNEIIHADSASLDNTTYKKAWNAVYQALVNLSSTLTPTCLNSNIAELKRLEGQIAHPSELQAVVDIMRDHRNYDNLQDKVNTLEEKEISNEDERQAIKGSILELDLKLRTVSSQLRGHDEVLDWIIKTTQSKIEERLDTAENTKYENIEGRVSALEIEQRRISDKFETPCQEQADIGQLQQYLVKDFQDLLNCAKFLPQDGQNVILKQIYVPSIVEEDTTKDGTKWSKSANIRIKDIKHLFYISGELVKRIFMKGEAGRGKTIFAHKLLDNWCKVQTGGTCGYMQNLMSMFKLTFFVSLRHITQGSTNVTDIVCEMLPSEYNVVAKNALMNENIQCLVILDGLDEMLSPSNNIFPDSRDLKNCVLFTTTRPWKLEKLRLKYGVFDKVVEIQGINPKCFKKVIKHIISKLYENDKKEIHDENVSDVEIKPDGQSGMAYEIDAEKDEDTILNSDTESDDEYQKNSALESDREFEMKFEEDFSARLKVYTKEVCSPKMKSLMSIPMILAASCHVWYENDKKKTGPKNIMTSLVYLLFAILDILIKRGAVNDKEIQNYFQNQGAEKRFGDIYKKTHFKSLIQKISFPKTTNIFNMLSRFFPKIIDFFDILSPFRILAYEDLMSPETRLVFEKDQLEREIGESTVKLALKVGFISQCKIPGSGLYVQNVSISFFHKLLQELMAAMHISSSAKVMESFTNNCNSIDKIQNMRNVILLAIGIDSSLAFILSKHIGEISCKDPDIITWRETKRDCGDKIRSVYKTQCECYSEMVNVNTMLDLTHSPQFHIYDVYLGNDYKDSEAVKLAGELVSINHHTIASVCLQWVLNTATIIRNLHQHSRTLTALRVMGCDEEGCELLLSVLPKLKSLKYIVYEGRHRDVDARILLPLTKMSQLKRVDLSQISLGENTLNVKRITKLKRLELDHVNMPAGSWRMFISGVLDLPQKKLQLALVCTDIDDESIKIVQSSQHFQQIKQHNGEDGETEYEFCKKE